MDEAAKPDLLAEVRKLKLLLYLILTFVLGAVPAFYAGLRQSSFEGDSWDRVATMMRRQNFAKALSMSQLLVSRQPNYAYGQSYLGYVYLAMGDVTNAESH